MNHKAIYSLYKNVVKIDDDTGAFDKDGNKVIIDENAVNNWIDPELYKSKRLSEYKSINEQLDMIYWDKINGTNLWQEHITSIKNKYPK